MKTTATKVLVIDDDADILEAIQLALHTDGFDVRITTKGEDVPRNVAEFNPDVIILDVLLSGNDGRVICRDLKKDNDLSTIPVIMISAHPSAKSSIESCGADSFLAKPFSVRDLLHEVRRLIV